MNPSQIPAPGPRRDRAVGEAEKQFIHAVRQALLAQIGAVKTGWLGRLESALNEAEAQAWKTSVPALVFPSLAKEKVCALRPSSRYQHCPGQPTKPIAFAA